MSDCTEDLAKRFREHQHPRPFRIPTLLNWLRSEDVKRSEKSAVMRFYRDHGWTRYVNKMHTWAI